MNKHFVRALLLYIKDSLRKFYNPGLYERLNAAAKQREEFYSGFLKREDLVYDVGANLGNRSSAFLGLGMKVLAIEPQSFCYHYLRLRFGSRINLLKIALGSSARTAELKLNSESSTIASLSDEWIEKVKQKRFSGMVWNKKEAVTVETLDHLIAGHGKPRFIKIDVEGYEQEVLRGLSQPVEMICFEYTTPEMKEQALQCLDILNGLSTSYLFNFSIGEENKFALARWISSGDMKNLLTNRVDTLEGFGDIYARLIPGP